MGMPIGTVRPRRALGLEHDGEVLLRPFCPPYFASMAEAVQAVVELKQGSSGVLRAPSPGSAWRDSKAVTGSIESISDTAIEATIAYCEYVHRRYGRFPAYLTPYRTVLGFQACHLDLEFYERYYRPEALSETQRAHDRRWHGA
jgi:hypothetical protein